MYFDKHIFFCLNERAAGETCCANFDSRRLQAYTKDKIKTPKIIKKGLMRNLIGNEIKRTKQISKLKSYKVYKKKKAYDYGKKAIKQGRKMGHINFVM